MRSWFLFCLMLCVSAVLAGCGTESPPSVSTSATIAFSEVEGGVWLLRAEDHGTVYVPRNLPEAFRVIGAGVQVTLVERRDLVSSSMAGIPADIVTIAFRQ